MGTRSRIAVRNPDNTYASIYCHWDGYPTGVGQTLKDHYTTPEKVAQLIALGNISSLGEEIGEKHAFGAGGNATTAYGRDRGETEQEAVTSADIDELRQLTQDSGGEWLYVFTGHGWQCAQGGSSAFGLPATEAPADLESVDYWIAKELAAQNED
jgi:hypothetical protein